MKRHEGFVLVNALLIVAALAALAIVLLERSQAGRTRLALAQEWTQTDLYLDGFEAFALTLLDRDALGPRIDGLADTWATAALDVELDRGRVKGRIVDLQGRFNLNQLAGGRDPAARAAFLKLAASAGLSEAQADAIAEFVETDGRKPLAGFAGRAIPMFPRGAPLVSLDQLRAVPGLNAAALARLSPLVSAIPTTSVNVNTAPRAVLEAVLPDGSAAALRDIMTVRERQPFETVEDFLLAVQLAGDADLDEIEMDRFSVETGWFLVETSASLGETVLYRQSVIRRSGGARAARVEYRLRRTE